MPAETASPSALRNSPIAGDPTIVCATDDAYVMPLAVTLLSAAQNLSADKRLRAHVFDVGIRDEHWTMLAESLRTQRVDLIRLPIDPAPVKHLPTSHHISHAAFVRLLAADWLPRSLERVIYVDSDFLFRDDLSRLWEVDLDGAWCGAVQDIACPFIDARYAPSNFRRAAPYMATVAPIRNWRALGLDPAGSYLNSGLLLIDLNAWRREALSERFMQCLKDYPRDVWCWDQYALNVVLAGHWKPLPLRWNQGSHAFDYPSVADSPVDPRDFQEMLEHPAALHFTTEFKPWNYGTRHPHRDEFFAVLSQTAWAEWQPSKPPFSIRRWSDRIGAALVKQATILSRKVQTLGYRTPSSRVGADPTPRMSSVASVSPKTIARAE